jgi:multiple sugar transport system substrate-binding protein
MRYILYFFVIINLLYPDQLKAEEVLTVGVAGTNGVAREMVYSLAATFEKQTPNVKIRFIVREGESYKKDLRNMLEIDTGYDVAFWMAGERFYKYVRLGLVSPINDIWQSHQLGNNFADNLNGAITFNQQIYAIPFSRYQWGMLYNKKLFDRLSLVPPSNWEQFIDVLTVLKSEGIIPIYVGSKYSWQISAWFEFLNLRLNGYEFHQSFIEGKSPVDSPEIRLVFKYWQQLIESGYYVVQKEYDLREGLPYLYRGLGGVMLAGSYFTAFVPPKKLNNIGFFSFPQINPQIENVEIAPVDIVFMAERSKNKVLAQKFLVFLSSKFAQEKFNSGSHFLPANNSSEIPKDDIFHSVQQSLNNVSKQTLFFDREAEEKFAQQNMSIWLNYIETSTIDSSNIDKAIKKMEEARLSLLSRSCHENCNNH